MKNCDLKSKTNQTGNMAEKVGMAETLLSICLHFLKSNGPNPQVSRARSQAKTTWKRTIVEEAKV